MSTVVKIRPGVKCCFECVFSRSNALVCGRTDRRTRYERSVQGVCGKVGIGFAKRIEVRRDA